MEEDPKYREYSEEDVKRILKDALKSNHLDREESEIPNRKEVMKALSSYMSNFLSCYHLMGYDLNGKPVQMRVFNNKLEEGALEHAFMEAIARHMNGHI